MNKERYVGSIVKKIKCSSAKRKEISRQLFSDINDRINNGDSMDDIISEMGTIKEIAEGFNENISDQEKKKYKTAKLCKIIIPIVIILAAIIIAAQLLIPKSTDINKSTYFNKLTVEENVKNCIDLLDEEDYRALQGISVESMKSTFTKEVIEDAKSKTSDDWGKRKGFGKIYSTEIVQSGKHYAVCEVTVPYENISVTYRITFDENMKIAGLYMR